VQVLQTEKVPSVVEFLKTHRPLSLPALSFLAEASEEELKQCLVSDGAFLRLAPDGQLTFIGDLERAGNLPVGHIKRLYAKPQDTLKIWDRIKPPGQEVFYVRELYFHLALKDVKVSGPDSDVRMLLAADFPKWFECYTDLLKDWGAPPSWTSRSVEKVFLQRVKEEQVLGLFRGEDLASTAAFSDVHEGWSRIGWVYTAPSHRKQGLAQKVMRSLFDQARKKGITDLVLYTNEANYRAHHLYEPMGFKVLGDVGLLGPKSE